MKGDKGDSGLDGIPGFLGGRGEKGSVGKQLGFFGIIDQSFENYYFNET